MASPFLFPHTSTNASPLFHETGQHFTDNDSREVSGAILPLSRNYTDEKVSTFTAGAVTLRVSLKKTIPSSSLRYRRVKCVETREMEISPEIARAGYPLSTELDGWVPRTHPEGAVYYQHVSKHCVTEANMSRPDIRNKITSWMAEFEAICARISVTLPEKCELLLELDLEDDQCSYYVVDHERRTVFWLDTTNTADLDLPDVSSPEHLRLKLEEQYWVHLEYFPMHGTLPPSAESDLVGILTHAWGDQTTSALSTAPYSAEQCRDFLAMLDRLIGRCDQDGYKTCLIARLMNELLHSRFINLYGHPEGSRLSRNQSTLPVSTDRQSKVFKLLCSTFLCQYNKELKDVKELWIDNIVYTEHWRAFLESRIHEWKSLTLLSSLLLLVDTLLVVNYHVNLSGLGSNLPVVRTGYVSGTMSLLLSLSTMIVGITTILIHQPYCKSYASEASEYLDRASHETLGLQPLAVLLSLPRSLFLWALVTGGIALLSFTFQVLDSWTVVFVGVFAAGLCALLVWVARFFQVRDTDRKHSFGLPAGGLFSWCFGKENLDSTESV